MLTETVGAGEGAGCGEGRHGFVVLEGLLDGEVR